MKTSEIPRPTFFNGQVLTADDLNSITAYLDGKSDRLRILAVTATLISLVTAFTAIVFAWLKFSK